MSTFAVIVILTVIYVGIWVYDKQGRRIADLQREATLLRLQIPPTEEQKAKWAKDQAEHKAWRKAREDAEEARRLDWRGWLDANVKDDADNKIAVTMGSEFLKERGYDVPSRFWGLKFGYVK